MILNTMTLYDYILSPNCYKVRLMASLTGQSLTLRPVDFHPGREHKSDEIRQLNPAGTLPILVDEGLILTESSAILTYLASKSDEAWLGDGSPESAARIQQWLSFSQKLSDNLGGARLVEMLHGSDQLGADDLPMLHRNGVAALRALESALLEQRLRGLDFLVASQPTIADIACFPFVALAPDGSISLDPYPSIRLWMRAVRSLENFVEMPGIHRLHDLAPDPQRERETA